MKQMTKKTLLFLALAILIAGGAGCAKVTTEKLDKNNYESNEDSSAIDTLDWKTYHSKEVGYELLMPQDWHGGNAHSGSEEKMVDLFNGTNINVNISSVKSDLALEDYDKLIDRVPELNNEGTNMMINGYESLYRKTPIVLNDREVTNINIYSEEYLIKNDSRIYQINFTTYFDDLSEIEYQKNLEIWRTVINTLSLFSVS